MELRDYLRILRAHWLGAALLVVAVLTAAAVYTLTQPKVYAASATGLVSVPGVDNAALSSIADDFAKSRAVSYVKVAESRAVAERALEVLGTDESPAAVAGRISVEQPPETISLEITARDATPQGAQDLANAWVDGLAAEVADLENPDGNATGVPVIQTLESALLPTSPVSPDPVRNLGIALVLGLLLGFAYALVRHTLDRRLRTAEGIEQRFDVTVVGVVPVTDQLGRKPGEQAEIAIKSATDRDADASEAFRKLRTNLVFMDVDNPPRVIVVTSPKPGDGKSTVSVNLAAAIALSGQRVVLVDADLRRPMIATSLGLVEGVGLTDVLVQRVDVEDALQPSAVHENLQVLAAGGIPPNPSELLGSNAMRSLVSKLSQEGLIILDAPPLLPVTDAAVLTANADGALVVISAGNTLDTELEAALGHLDAVKGRALGIILNRAPRKGQGSYYYSGYYGRQTGPAASGA